MNQAAALELRITHHLAELRAVLARCSTESVAGRCFVRQVLAARRDGTADRLMSPAKQIPFLFAVLLSTPEPDDPVEFDEKNWDEAAAALERLFSSYLLLYMPKQGDLGRVAADWRRTREVSMLAFLHYFNNGLMASVQQVADRIGRYLVPFDNEIRSGLGISVTQAVAICHWISKSLQASMDRTGSAVEAVKKAQRDLFGRAQVENLSADDLEAASRDPVYAAKATNLLTEMRGLGVVSLPDLEAEFPESANAFWKQFSIQRGKGAETRYPTEQSIYELRPLVEVSAARAICPSVNSLFVGVLLAAESFLLKSEVREKYLRSRDKNLEIEARVRIEALFGATARVWSGVFETPASQYEHDLVVQAEGLYLFVEAKAAPPIEPFRDPDRAYVRLRDSFRADRGIQKGFEQANRLVRRFSAGEVVPLFNAQGQEVTRITPDPSQWSVGVCITRDNFGGLGTNLSLLLEKEAGESYPWVINILDLANLAEAWVYFGWGAKELRKYLEQRVRLHGKVFSDDELDYAGYFISHGDFGYAIKAPVDLFHLNPQYSSVFDDLYKHLHWGGPPVKVATKDPVLMDLRRSLSADAPVFVDQAGTPLRQEKVGRNAVCPCGSGKKYKRCCGGL